MICKVLTRLVPAVLPRRTFPLVIRIWVVILAGVAHPVSISLIKRMNDDGRLDGWRCRCVRLRGSASGYAICRTVYEARAHAICQLWVSGRLEFSVSHERSPYFLPRGCLLSHSETILSTMDEIDRPSFSAALARASLVCASKRTAILSSFAMA